MGSCFAHLWSCLCFPFKTSCGSYVRLVAFFDLFCYKYWCYIKSKFKYVNVVSQRGWFHASCPEMGEISLSHLLVTGKWTHNQVGEVCYKNMSYSNNCQGWGYFKLWLCIDNSRSKNAVIAGIWEHFLAVKLTYVIETWAIKGKSSFVDITCTAGKRTSWYNFNPSSENQAIIKPDITEGA